MSSNFVRVFLIVFFLAAPTFAAKLYTYVGDIGPTHVLLAWGSTAGPNTIGRSSKPHGKATVRLGGQEVVVADCNWTVIRNLQPDTEYSYEVLLDGSRIATSKIRTWPAKSEKLRFFVIGDFGTGDSAQRRVAAAMVQEFQRLWGDNPVRFVLTTGDNIYGELGFALRFRNSGDEDKDWDSKFFGPYAQLLAQIPFYGTLGNHDGNETEARGDLEAYLDNLFFPGFEPARYYRFSYGGFVDFFALDSTTNTERGPARPVYLENEDEHKWLVKNLTQSEVPWKIPYMHHPPFNAGPRHPAARNDLRHFLDVFKKEGVRVVFSGHEHNFQFSEKSGETGDIRYVITGAGGELRNGNVRGEMQRAHIEGWAAVNHFLSVEIEGKEMRITPISFQLFDVVDRNGKKIEMPLKITLP